MNLSRTPKPFLVAALVAIAVAGLFWAMPGTPLEEIVYIGSEGRLCGVSPHGGGSRCTGSGFSDPAWRPGGGQIAVQAGTHGGSRYLVTLRPDGRMPRKVPGSTGYIRPEWFPNGDDLYALNYDLGPAVGRWDGDGKGPERIPVEGLEVPDPMVQFIAFSPSGTRVFVLLNAFDTAVIALVEGDVIRVERTILSDFHYVAHAVWRSEFHLLFVAARKKGEPRALWEVDVDDGEARRIAVPGLALGEFIALSPNRKSVVLNATPVDGALSWDLWRYELGAATPTRLTEGGAAWSPSWRQVPSGS